VEMSELPLRHNVFIVKRMASSTKYIKLK
jgi:hypothetical protein